MLVIFILSILILLWMESTDPTVFLRMFLVTFRGCAGAAALVIIILAGLWLAGYPVW